MVTTNDRAAENPLKDVSTNDLFAHLEFIRRQVEWAEKPGDPAIYGKVRRAVQVDPALSFAIENATDVPDDGNPDREKVVAALMLFFDQPRQLTSLVLGGWAPQLKRAPADRIRECEETASPVRVLRFDFDGSSACASQQFTLSLDIYPGVTIMIREGTTRRDALVALERTRLSILERWDNLMALEPDTMDPPLSSAVFAALMENEKSDGRKSPGTPELGSTGNRVSEPTVAV